MNVSRPAARSSTGKNLLSVAFSIGLAIASLFFLFSLTNVHWQDLLTHLVTANWFWLACLIPSTLLHFVLSGTKWQLVINSFAKENSEIGISWWLAIALTASGYGLGKLIPQTAAVVGARAVGGRLYNTQIAKSIAATIYEQGFDAIVIIIAASVGLGSVVLQLNMWLCLALGTLVMLFSGVILANYLRKIIETTYLLFRLLPTRWLRTQKLLDKVEILKNQELFDRATTTQIYSLSVIRFFNLTFRSYCVALALGLSISWYQIFLAMPLVQLSMLISLTPGNLGVAEWTWTGLLAFAGADTVTATQFSVLHRIIVAPMVLLMGILLWLVFLLTVPPRQNSG